LVSCRPLLFAAMAPRQPEPLKQLTKGILTDNAQLTTDN
jgi:hypothetical protein